MPADFRTNGRSRGSPARRLRRSPGKKIARNPLGPGRAPGV